MKRTIYDVPIGQAKGTPSALVPKLKSPKKKKKTIVQLAKEYGINPQSISKFRFRHPECKAWSLERVCEQIVANKNKSEAAKRQGVIYHPHKAPTFKKVTYEE